MGWNIDPSGMTELLLDLHHTYPELPLMITENGAAFPDAVIVDEGRVRDTDRVLPLPALDAVGDAMDAGADVRYFVWSLWTTSSGATASQALRHRADRLRHARAALEGLGLLVPRADRTHTLRGRAPPTRLSPHGSTSFSQAPLRAGASASSTSSGRGDTSRRHDGTWTSSVCAAPRVYVPGCRR